MVEEGRGEGNKMRLDDESKVVLRFGVYPFVPSMRQSSNFPRFIRLNKTANRALERRATDLPIKSERIGFSLYETFLGDAFHTEKAR